MTETAAKYLTDHAQGESPCLADDLLHGADAIAAFNLLDAAFSLAGFEEDQDTGDDEPHSDDEHSLGVPDGITDQSRQFPTTIMVGDKWQSTGGDLELDPAEHEPSLGSLDGEVNQERWAVGDRLDRERGEGGGDCDDNEDTDGTENDQDLEPEHEEPSLSSCGPGVGSSQNFGAIDGEDNGYGQRDPRDVALRAKLAAERRVGEMMAAQPKATPRGSNQHMDRVERRPDAPASLADAGIDKHLADRARKLAQKTADGEPPELWLPTGNRPDGRLEMRNQTTGQTVAVVILGPYGRPL